jgi:glycerol-3-phosphate dehydrogenase subunit B
VADQLKPKLGQAARIGFPAVLGVEDALRVKRDLEERLGCPVFEIPILPPSIPGMRWHRILVTAIERARGQVFNGMEAVAADAEGQRMTRLWTEAAARRKPHQAERFVLATGGILGGGIVADYEGQIREVVCDLPVWAPAERSRWFRRDFLDASGHPIYRAGVEVNGAYRPLDGEGQVVYQNLMVIGTGLAHCDALRERAFEGVALVTGYQAGKLMGQESNPAGPE